MNPRPLSGNNILFDKVVNLRKSEREGELQVSLKSVRATSLSQVFTQLLPFLTSFTPKLASFHFSLSHNKTLSLNLTSSQSIFGFTQFFPSNFLHLKTPLLSIVFAAKGYKMKTHKLVLDFLGFSRFWCGNWKIVRRRARKQHLLAKKNAKRKNRLSKMVSFLECFHFSMG
ncbi:hypothetical protein IFM89_010338 [Coptis chinensis]|uniref:50S ribosomal protein L35, chloroplastic n=1 Tax=Coptis chinensis TaxID=261450 RepID=A0A835HV70_9MAGN|nr:hypothetical protein IFM89_010338 [Coptis chinensis]